MIFLSELSFFTFFRAIFLSSTAASHASFHQYFLFVRLDLLLFLLFELLAIVFRAAFFISSSIFWQCSCIFPLLVSFEFWSILWNSGQLAFSVLKLSVGGDSSSSSSPIRVVKHGRWSDPPVSYSVSLLTASYGNLFVVIVRSIAVCDCFLVSAILVGFSSINYVKAHFY